MFLYELGRKAKDTVTGFTGTLIGRCEYLHGNNSYAITAKSSEKNTKIITEWFEETRIQILGIGKRTK